MKPAPKLLAFQSPRHRPGSGFGVPQGTLVAAGPLPRCDEAALGRIERGLSALLREPPPPRAAEEGAPQRVASLCAFAAGSIQREARIAVAKAWQVQRVTTAAEPLLRIAVPSPDEPAGVLALEWAQETINRLAAGQDGATAEILALLKPHGLPGLNTFHIVSAALDLGLPVQRFGTMMLLLGTGNRSRALDSTITDATPAIGVRLARSKSETARLLRRSGLPGSVHQLVDSAASAATAAGKLGYPVVVKPDDMERGAGVAAGLRDAASVAQAFEAARKLSKRVLVERWAPGFTHRLTVFNGKVVRVNRRIAGGVVGDGQRTVAQLMQAAQARLKERGTLLHLGRTLLALDDEALGLLAQEGRDAGYVPAAGEYVRLRRRDNINAGGENQPVPLGDVHPDNLRLAVDAAALLYLDFAGIDLIAQDIGRSWFGTEAVICEVNAQPQLGARSDPGLYQRVLRELVGEQPRIPATLVIAADSQALDDELRRLMARRAPCVSSPQGLWLGGCCATSAFPNGFQAARALLRRRDASEATCLMTAEEVDRFGLPLDAWDRIVFDGETNQHTAPAAALARGHAPDDAFGPRRNAGTSMPESA